MGLIIDYIILDGFFKLANFDNAFSICCVSLTRFLVFVICRISSNRLVAKFLSNTSNPCSAASTTSSSTASTANIACSVVLGFLSAAVFPIKTLLLKSLSL